LCQEVQERRVQDTIKILRMSKQSMASAANCNYIVICSLQCVTACSVSVFCLLKMSFVSKPTPDLKNKSSGCDTVDHRCNKRWGEN